MSPFSVNAARIVNRAAFYVRSLFRGKSAITELDEELRYHLAMQAEENRRSGMSGEEAHYAARRQFGGMEQRREECSDHRPTRWVEDLLSDLSTAFRSLRKRPLMTLIAVASLAIGIGANSALFSVMDATLLHAVPLPDADRLVALVELKNGELSGGNPPRIYDWGTLLPGLEAIAGSYSEQTVLSGRGDAFKVEALRTCGDPLKTLNIQPELGRGFTADEQRGIGDVTMLSHDAWQHRFGGQMDIIGQSLVLGGEEYRVIGILPVGLTYPTRAEVWVPMSHEMQAVDRRAGFVLGTGRMKPGVTLQQLQAQVAVACARLAQQYPASDGNRSANATALNEVETRAVRKPLLILWATTLLVLLLACVNFASLCLSRSLAREREASIRLALGAGISRLVRLYLTESLLMAIMGGVTGLLAARGALTSLVSALPSELPNVEAISLNGRVVAVTLLLALVCGLAAGFFPAWRIARNAAADRLTERGSTSNRQSLWVQKALLACQIALSVVLLTGAALLTHSLLRLAAEPLGFEPAHVLAVKIGLSWDTPQDKLNEFSRSALSGFSAIPGVRSVGLIDRLPLNGGAQGAHISIRNRPFADGRETTEVSLRATAGSYFTTVGIPLMSGRFFSDAAQPDVREVVVNKAFANRFFKNEDPIGQAIEVNASKKGAPKWSEIVGVVADVRQDPAQEAPPEVYESARATFWPILTFVLNSSGDPRAPAHEVRQVIHRIDASQSIDSIQTMDESVLASRTQPRLRAIAFSAFAIVALLLASLGIYGLQSQTVSQRSKEIALRLALGAKPTEAMFTVLRQNIAVLGLGLLLGSASAAALVMFLKSLIYGVDALDPVAFIAGGIGLALTALVASFVPARRAATVDPASTLRHE